MTVVLFESVISEQNKGLRNSIVLKDFSQKYVCLSVVVLMRPQREIKEFGLFFHRTSPGLISGREKKISVFFFHFVNRKLRKNIFLKRPYILMLPKQDKLKAKRTSIILGSTPKGVSSI